MFTGLIQTIGQIRSIAPRGNYQRLTVVPDKMFDALEIGESIALSGICLTVVSFDNHSFVVEASQETTATTTLGGVVRTGLKINLERALRADSRLGGHFVAGHIDDALTVLRVVSVGESIILEIELPIQFSALVVNKGSVTIDGVSLTIVDLKKNSFSVNLIPETQASTTLTSLRKGAVVNVEFDMIGKYIERFMNHSQDERTGQLTVDKLRKHGF